LNTQYIQIPLWYRSTPDTALAFLNMNLPVAYLPRQETACLPILDPRGDLGIHLQKLTPMESDTVLTLQEFKAIDAHYWCISDEDSNLYKSATGQTEGMSPEDIWTVSTSQPQN